MFFVSLDCEPRVTRVIDLGMAYPFWCRKGPDPLFAEWSMDGNLALSVANQSNLA